MKIILNGEPSEVADGLTLAALLEAKVGTTRGSAAAVDGEVVPRGEWTSRTLAEGDSVELITAVQGG